MEKVVPLVCAYQQYAWGKFGADSAVAQLQVGNGDFKLQNDKPYAELWCGTHPSGPSKVKSKGELVDLGKLIKDHPAETLGEEVSKHWGDLPYLFKVLSIRTALSIQAHPDRTLARALHAAQPDLYRDPNHKPEIAIALTPFDALCRFRPIKEIGLFLKRVPELRALVGDTALAFDDMPPSESSREDALKALFTSLMNSAAPQIEEQLHQLVTRLKTQDNNDDTDKLALRLHEQYPGDIGVFSVYLLNHVILKPGEGLYMGANEPHAYISGDCFECMATSDNVVRAGLTPKFKDVSTLCNMLTYAAGAPQLLSGVIATSAENGNTRVYAPPVEEFQVEVITATGPDAYPLRPSQGPTILVVNEGSGKLTGVEGGDIEVKRGTVLFACAGIASFLLPNEGESVVAYRACVNDAFWR
jgi:mannose-6-phosphate isomerase